MFKNTSLGIAFRTTTTLHQFIRPKKQTRVPDHEKSGIYKIMCNTCHKAYVGQTSRNLKSRYQEHTRHIKNNDPRSAYTLHILNSRHEYGNINDKMTLLKRINKPALLLPYEQMYIQSLSHNNEPIPEQHLIKHNPIFKLLQRKHPTSQPT
jgi:predicted GIY-YIG superfamily endonuclease